MTMKKLAYGSVSLAALCLVLMLTPMGASAQQAIRNVIVDGFDTLLTSAAAIEAATESSQVALESIESNLSADAVHANAVIATGPQQMREAADFDGSALPNAVTEGQSARGKSSMSGIDYVMLLNEDGSAVGSVAQSGTWTVSLAADKNACADISQVSAVAISTASSGNVELVAISGSTIVYVCGFDVTSQADVSVQFISGTGSACGTGETNRTGTYPLVAASGAGLRGIARANGGAPQFKGAAGEALCIELSGAVQVDGLLTYVQR